MNFSTQLFVNLIVNVLPAAIAFAYVAVSAADHFSIFESSRFGKRSLSNQHVLRRRTA